jgi:phosphatidylglycerophosphate synthase
VTGAGLPQGGQRWLTLANLLTLLRLLAAPLLALAVWRGASLAAGALFWGAVASDFADGRIARRRREASSLGGLLDHATDATCVSFGLLALAARGVLSVGLPILVVLAFAQYAGDSRALKGHPLRTSRLGRWNGIAYFALLGTPITRDLLGFPWPSDALVSAGAWILVVTTLASMIDRALALIALRRRVSS